MNPKKNRYQNQVEIQKILITYFNDGEIRQLCFELGIDYDDLPIGGRQLKATELVKFLDRRSKLQELLNKIEELRPHAGLNIQELMAEVIPADDERLQDFSSLLAQIKRNFEELREWKELHNFLEVTLLSFDQFLKQVERFSVKKNQPDMGILRETWFPVSLKIDQILIWAENEMQYIGEPFRQEENGERRGEKWAISVENSKDEIITHFDLGYQMSKKVTLFRHLFNRARYWEEWWQLCVELANRLNNELRKNLFLADRELRQTASSLYDLSKESLWGDVP